MYYILNETNQMIAADDNLLGLFGVSHIDALSLKIALGEIKFDPASETIIITTDNQDKTFPISKTSLSSMLGHLTLVELQAEKKEALPAFILDDMEERSNLLHLDSDIVEDNNELFDLALEQEAEDNIEKIEDSLNLLSQDTQSFDLDLSSIKDEDITDASSEIHIDIEKISQQIGVSHEDYDTFLNEYIDTALGLEQDLQSTDTQKRSNAVATLSHLSEVLQLPVVGDIIANVASASSDKQRETVQSFFNALSKLTTTSDSQKEALDLDIFEPQEIMKETDIVDENSFGSIHLDDVEPIHFDFQLEEAANDLSLPIELIEEFVHDFIEQGHLETQKMLKAYQKGDLKTIQKIGHLLKGASSNLRINDLSDTLYKIQFCEESKDLEDFIKDYWGHFLSFELQINALVK